jgi:hypothetical protein
MTAAVSGSEAQPFDLDALLSEFNVGSKSAVPPHPQDDAVARVRESLGLGRSIFRRKESVNQEAKEGDPVESRQDDSPTNSTKSSDEDVPRVSRQRRRIVETDDEEDLTIIKARPGPRTLSPAPSIARSSTLSLHNSDSDSEDEFSTEKMLEDYRKARVDALANLNAKAVPKTQQAQQGTEDEMSVVSETLHSPARSSTPYASPPTRKTNTRRASKKALEDMHRETQRMARNMALRPEVKVSKKIDMNTIFAKFGFDPFKATDDNNTVSPDNVDEPVPQHQEVVSQEKTDISDMPLNPPEPIRFNTPNLEDSDSDEPLPSPSKLACYLSQIPAKPPTPTAPTLKLSSPRKVHFTLPQSPSMSDEDSDVEIVPPPDLLTTHATTPNSKIIKRTAFIRSLAGVRSPGQMRKSPGHMTAKELDATLSKEAAVQAKRKRDERRAELKSLGIDLEKIVEKRDLLEEAREEARRVRDEEAADDESEDEEYLDEEAENEGDEDESGEENGEESIEDDEEMPDTWDEKDQDEIIQEVLAKRKGRKLQITSDDEGEAHQSQNSLDLESLIGSHNNPLHQISPDHLSLSQFFRPTQMSGVQQSHPVPESQSQTNGETTGLTQFFQSTAMEDEGMWSNDSGAHGQMELLRQQAGTGNAKFGEISAGLPPAAAAAPSSLPPSHSSPPSVESVIQRRILKRRAKPRLRAIIDETSEEFQQSRKEFIEEQAEESEDDYKAWGSGDESEHGDLDAVVEDLIDDETKVKKNTEAVARLYMFVSAPIA